MEERKMKSKMENTTTVKDVLRRIVGYQIVKKDELKEAQYIQYVGCYILKFLKWECVVPEVFFIETGDEDLDEAEARIREIIEQEKQ